MEKRIKRLFWTNAVVILLTLCLFVFALFTKGITHDLFLEAAVFLVSVKLILTTVHIKHLAVDIDNKLDTIHAAILKSSSNNRS